MVSVTPDDRQGNGCRWPLVRNATFGVLITALLPGCGSGLVNLVHDEARSVERELRERREKATATSWSRVTVVDGPWVGLEAAPPQRDHNLPERFLAPDAVTLPLAGADSPPVLAARIGAATGLHVRFVGPPRRGRETAAIREAFRQVLADGHGLHGDLWTGRLDHLLDRWTEAGGYAWRYDPERKRIEILRTVSVVFQVHALSGEQRYNVSSSTLDQENGEGSSNRNFQAISTRTRYNPWPEIREQLTALVGKETRITIAPSSASVAVRGTPGDVARVRDYLAWLNREVLRPVSLSVHVYSVRFEREVDYELGIGFAVSRLFGTSLRLEAAERTVALVRPEAATTGDTLNAAVRALNRAGTASRVLSATIPSLNGKPAQFYELFKDAYLKEVRTTVSDGSSQTQMVPGTVSSGFALSYLPRITGPDEILVRISASLQDRPVFTRFTSREQSIQLPSYGTRAVQVTQRIGRGETLVVSGFRDRDTGSGRDGAVDPDLPLPGGSRSAQSSRTERVLLINAEIGAPLGISEVHGARL